jgi:hypothetical protein
VSPRVPTRDSGRVRDREAAERWICGFVEPAGAIQIARERPWSTVLRVPVAGGSAWFKTCGAGQAFEPRLSSELFQRWPDRVGEVLGYDEQRGWLLTAHAGVPIGALGNPPEVWAEVLPRYSELQRDEAAFSNDHIAHGVPSLAPSTLPSRYAEMLERRLPLEPDELARPRFFSPRFEQLGGELAAGGLPATVQHDDLHMGSVYHLDGRFRVLDWGDSSISHPFFSLVVTFRFLEERTGLQRHDPRFARLRDAYLEPRGMVSMSYSSSPCVSAASRMRSPGPVSVSFSPRPSKPHSTSGSRTSFGARSTSRDHPGRCPLSISNTYATPSLGPR